MKPLRRVALLLMQLSFVIGALFGQSAVQSLERPILDPMQPTLEMQVYVGSRVPPLPVLPTSAAWNEYAARIRSRVLNEVIFRGAAAEWRKAHTKVEWFDTIEAADYRIRKLRYEAVPGLWVPALLYEPKILAGRTAAVLNLNGHEKNGKAEQHWQINCINQARRGMIALKPDWLGTGQLAAVAHNQMNQIDLTGASGVSVFYLAMSRALDLLAAQAHVDPARIAVTGLSGGGWQTIIISSLDTRVALADPVAGYSSFITKTQMPKTDLGDSEQVMTDLATIADYTHLTALLAPRWALLTNNAKDNCCFRADYAMAPLLSATSPVYRLLNAPQKLSHYISFDPGHNYARGNREAFYAALKRAFYPGDDKFPEADIDCEKELRTPEQLSVPLPEGNLSLNLLARKLAAGLPRTDLVSNPAEARRKLGELVRPRRYAATWKQVGREEAGNISIGFYQISMNADWTVPAVVLTGKGPSRKTTLMFSDNGLASLGSEALRAVEATDRVVVFDPLNFGENRIQQRNQLWTLILSGIGERMLGLQASQIQAIARTAAERFEGPVGIDALGPRASLAALVAGVLDPKIATAIRTQGARTSLHELIDSNITVEREPESFCFGLLESFDIPQLRALAKASEMPESSSQPR